MKFPSLDTYHNYFDIWRGGGLVILLTIIKAPRRVHDTFTLAYAYGEEKAERASTSSVRPKVTHLMHSFYRITHTQTYMHAHTAAEKW